jgi:hypothetical protein
MQNGNEKTHGRCLFHVNFLFISVAQRNGSMFVQQMSGVSLQFDYEDGDLGGQLPQIATVHILAISRRALLARGKDAQL